MESGNEAGGGLFCNEAGGTGHNTTMRATHHEGIRTAAVIVFTAEKDKKGVYRHEPFPSFINIKNVISYIKDSKPTLPRAGTSCASMPILWRILGNFTTIWRPYQTRDNMCGRLYLGLQSGTVSRVEQTAGDEAAARI